VLRSLSLLAALSSSLLLLVCVGITLLDSVHFRALLPPAAGVPDAAPAYDTRTRSLLDALLSDLVESREATYSRPLAFVGFTKDSVQIGDEVKRVAPRLVHGGSHLQDPETQWLADVVQRTVLGLLGGAAVAAGLGFALVALLARRGSRTIAQAWQRIRDRADPVPWHAALWTLAVLGLVAGPATALSGPYHLMGTDLTGNDVLYQSLKSIRTAFVIGALATVATLPLAVVLGLLAGYFRGWVDELIQYLYTVLSSVPNVLLIAACVLMVQVFLDTNPGLF